jgi:hypothetical protein
MKKRIENHMMVVLGAMLLMYGCGKNSDPAPAPPPVPANFTISNWEVNGSAGKSSYKGTNINPAIKLIFPQAIDRNTVPAGISFNGGNYLVAYTNGDSVLSLQPTSSLTYLTKYTVAATTALKSKQGGVLFTPATFTLQTSIDSSRKFPLLTDEALLDKVQLQTFNYFWDYGHPVSGLARERSNGTPETVTSGGSGFGIMAIITGIHRNFITRQEGLTRMQKIVGFLKNSAVKVKGAFPHWLNGTTGAIIPFSANDNGADLVETSYLMMGLLTARQYFNGTDAEEISLRSDINLLYNNVEWDWFQQGNQNVLYWHYSNDKGWAMNHQVRGWNECLVTYIMAASSGTHGIPSIVYTNGWAGNGSNGFINGATYYGNVLPLGPNLGGPLFFAHYSFLGIKPTGLSDPYGNYQTQTVNHSKINYSYCVANPKNYYGYSDSVWGLTASDIPNGYTASSPTNDVGVIAPTAALSSFPYTPVESMKAMKFFYYTLGDKLWGQYGFKDAFSLHEPWFADSYLAIDQGPVIVMIENYRSGLLWDLFSSCPEIKNGMKNVLGFSAPWL